MGGLGKTTLAAKVFNDPFIVYHFRIRAWVTISQTYEKWDLLKQILVSIGVQVHLEEDSKSTLHGKLHKHLMGERYLIVIDDIWSIEAWDDLKVFFPHENTGSRILLTSRLNEVAMHANPHGLVHSLPYLTEEQSWELLCKKVFHGDECPKWLIEPGMQITKKCQGLPLSLVLMAGVLAKEARSKDLWEKIACDVSSYIVSEEKGYLEILALSYHHLPCQMRECFLYLGGFPEDFRISVKKLILLWVAEGFIEEVGNQSLEDIAKAYLMDLIDRNLLIVVERTFDGDVKACKLHDLVRYMCLKKAEEKRFILIIDGPVLPNPHVVATATVVTTPYKQHRVFTRQDIYILNFPHMCTACMRSLLFFCWTICFNDQIPEFFNSFVLLRVLDLQKHALNTFPQWIALLVHLRYLGIWYLSDFPSAICNLWSLQTLIFKNRQPLVLPRNISDLVNLRHLSSRDRFYLPSIDKPMNLESISHVVLENGVENFQKCFPSIKKFSCVYSDLDEVDDFELIPFLETLKLSVSFFRREPFDPSFVNSCIRFPATLKKLTLCGCCLPWNGMSSIQSLPNLEVLKLRNDAFMGPSWNIDEEQFRRLKFLRLQSLDFKQWEVCGINFPCLKRLQVLNCDYLEGIPIEIGDMPMLELLEVNSQSFSVLESIQKIQLEQHAVGNYEQRININGVDLATFSKENAEFSFMCSLSLLYTRSKPWSSP